MTRRGGTTVLLVVALLAVPVTTRAWGFGVHRLVNEKAAGTLPEPLRELVREAVARGFMRELYSLGMIGPDVYVAAPDMGTDEQVMEWMANEYEAIKRVKAPAVITGKPILRGGSLGREEIDVIAPAVAAARAQGIDALGPLPADTIFVRARRDGFHGVVSMFHDQCQIAMKLMGFDRGITVLAGLPFPVGTPAHGTAFAIVGQGIANPEPIGRAFDMALGFAAA